MTATSTPTPSAASIVAPTPTPVRPTDDPDGWDVVVLSDSAGFGVADALGKLVAAELGVTVRVWDHASGALSADGALGNLRYNASQVATHVAWAELIVIEGGPLVPGLKRDILNVCLGAGDLEPVRTPEPYTEADWAPYERVMDDLYAAILELRAGRPTVLRTFDVYYPSLLAARAKGIEAECTAVWETWSDAGRRAAERNGSTFISVYDAFNGLEHDQDAYATGLLLPDDVHATEAGIQLIAETIAAAGFEPTDGGR